MKEGLLTSLSREQAQEKLIRVNPEFSVADSIADELSLTVFDQPEALKKVAQRLAMWQMGLTNPNRPIGSLLFLGPPGVGKTETARAVSQYFFSDPNSRRLIRLDMSDYSESHHVNKIIGSPQGYVGSDEASAIPHEIVNQKGPTIVLLDEVEKAHPTVIKVFLQALQEGRINARNGSNGFEPLDFTRTLFLMTSNLASERVIQIEKGEKKKIGFGAVSEFDKERETQKVIKEALKNQFPPEFLDRLDSVVVFKPVDSDETRRAILGKFLAEQNTQFTDRWAGDAPYLALTEEARQAILENKDDKGGRGIRRRFDEMVLSQLPDVMMGMDYKRRPFVADIEDGKTVWYTDVRDPEREEVKQLTAGKSEKKYPSDPWGFVAENDDDALPPREDPVLDGLENGEEPPQMDEKPINRNVRFHIPGGDKNWPTLDISIQIHEEGRPDKIQIVEGIPLIHAE